METAKLEKTENAEEIVIRRVKGSEFNQVFELVMDAFARARAGLTGLDVRRRRRMARFYRLVSGFLSLFDILHIDFETVLVAVCGDKVVGEVHVVPHGRRIWSIESAAVDARFRGRGIFRNLMKEAVGYIAQRRGERIVGIFLTSTAAAAKVLRELEFEIFEERSLMHLEIRETPLFDIKSDLSIKALQKEDIQQVYEICKRVDQTRMETYKFVPEDLLDSFASRLRKKIASIHSKKWVLHRDGKAVGYVSLTYTSPEEAGNIEPFYILPSENSSELASVLLSHVLNFLWTNNVRRVLVKLNKDYAETIEVFLRFGFKHVAFIGDVMKKPAYENHTETN